MKNKAMAWLLVLVLISLSLYGCSGSNNASTSKGKTPADKSTNKGSSSQGTNTNKGTAAPNVVPTSFHQAPMLDKESNLPSVKDRLPNKPKLVNEEPPEFLKYQIGKYGGTLRTVTSVLGWDADVFVMNDEPLLNTPGILGKTITGNVLEGYKVSDDQKTFTFTMRNGLKWSDGQPVTTEDVRFTYEDILNNKELTPDFPSLFRAGGDPKGTPGKLKILDKYHFQLSFDKPYGGLPIRLAIQGWRGYSELIRPAHFLKKYHKKYADPKQLAQEIKQDDMEKGDWVSLFSDKDVTNWELTHKQAIGFPVLYPWVQVRQTKTVTIYKRNPYYFKVDSAGNQLPYIDEIDSSLVQDINAVTLNTIAGKVDFSRESAALNKMPLYKKNEKKSGYTVLMSKMHVNPTDIFLNLTYKDPKWQKVVQDVRFRKALSMAINSKEIINTLYYGFADPNPLEPQYNVDAANQLLDAMGMKKGSDGYRTYPDGTPFVIHMELGAQAPDIVPLGQLIQQYWKQIGIDVKLKTIDQSLWGDRSAADELQATIIWATEPLWYYADWGQGFWGNTWNTWWNSGGKKGVEPPQKVKDLYSMLGKVNSSPTDEAQKAIEGVKKSFSENYWYFAPITNVKQPMIVNKNLGNVTDKGYAIGSNFSGETFFFKN